LTIKRFDARTLALADGTTVTSTNNASPDAWSLSNANGGTATIRATPAPQCVSFNATVDTSTARADWTGLNATAVDAEVMFDFRGISAPTQRTRIMAHFFTGQNAACGVNLNTDGTLAVVNALGAVLFTGPASVLGKRIRIKFGMEIGTTTTSGKFRMDCFVDTDADGTTPTAGHSYSATNVNAGTATTFNAVRFGKISTNGVAIIPVEYAHYDDTTWNSASLGPIALVAPPVASFTQASVVEVTASATNGGTLALTYVSGPTPTISGPVSGVFRVVLANPMTSNTTLNLTATNASGSDTKVVTIAPTGGTVIFAERTALTYSGSAWV
jgi:hypothetical protein